MSLQRIIPNIWINREAEVAGRFYAEALPFTDAEVEARYPETGLADLQAEFAGAPLTVAVTVAGTRLTLVNGGDEFRTTPALSFMLNFDPLLFGGSDETATTAARTALDRTWEALCEGGSVLMELGKYPFSPHYGWVADRYGVNWQLMLTDPSGDPRPFLVPTLMFGGDAQDKAVEAADFYTSLFADVPGGSGSGHRFPYGEPTGPASADALSFGEFRIGDQWFVGNDMGYDHGFGFTEGVSLEFRCADQDEIDRIWSALSAVPEAEQCGWLKDRYGVSWQVVPENLAELMERPDAYEHMMAMKKLVIEDF